MDWSRTGRAPRANPGEINAASGEFDPAAIGPPQSGPTLVTIDPVIEEAMMAQVQSGRATGPDTRRTPMIHDESLQKAKRLEKMQTVCSSHRVSGSASLPGGIAKAPPSN